MQRTQADKFALTLMTRITSHDLSEKFSGIAVYHSYLLSLLIKSSNSGFIQTSQSDLMSNFTIRRDKDSFAVNYGEVDRSAANPKNFILRKDNSLFNFGFTAGIDNKTLQILAYRFCIIFPDSKTSFRFDLNSKDHLNDVRNMRSHCHPDGGDIQAPFPVLRPDEALGLLIHGLH